MEKNKDLYDIEKTKEMLSFHKSRRMFYIRDEKLVIAEKNSTLSDFEWLETKGISKSDFKDILRGFVNKNGDIFIYKGINFYSDGNTLKEFVKYLPKLVEKLKLNTNAKVYGGLVKTKAKAEWDPVMHYGEIEDFL